MRHGVKMMLANREAETARYTDRRGREHYDNGRYAPMKDASREEPRMNKIGFSLDGEMERLPKEFDNHYRASAEYPVITEGVYQSGNGQKTGKAAADSVTPITEDLAFTWTKHMENDDGTAGPHWTMEQTNQVKAQKGIDCDPLAFYVALNMMYSDYSGVAKRLGMNTIDFYAFLAEAFLNDKDSRNDKLARYYKYVVKH